MNNVTSSIIVPVITQLVEEARAAVAAVRDAEALVEAYDRKLGESRDIAKARRMELGMLLRKAREQLPKRGTDTNGFTAFLGAIEMSESTAYRYMEESGWVSGRALSPSVGDSGRSASSGPDAPPPLDEDIPADELADGEPKPNRDGYCTPLKITSALPEVDLDPCSNPRSHVRARKTYSLECHENGLELPWFGLIFVNFPYSEPLPWAEKFETDRQDITGAGFLVNTDQSPKWWKVLTNRLHLRLDFDDRIQFDPPEGVEPSKNDRPQTLLMDLPFWRECNQAALLELGTLWERKKKSTR